MGEIIDFASKRREKLAISSAPQATPLRPDNSEIPAASELFDVLAKSLGLRIPTGSSILDDNQVMIDEYGMSLSDYRKNVEANMGMGEQEDKARQAAIVLMERVVAKKRIEALNSIPKLTKDRQVALADVATDTYRRGVLYGSDDLTAAGAILLTKAYGATRAGRVAENIKIKMQLYKQ